PRYYPPARMYGFLVSVLILDSLVLTTAILLQAGQGGGLASLGGGAGTEQFMGGRGDDPAHQAHVVVGGDVSVPVARARHHVRADQRPALGDRHDGAAAGSGAAHAAAAAIHAAGAATVAAVQSVVRPETS